MSNALSTLFCIRKQWNRDDSGIIVSFKWINQKVFFFTVIVGVSHEQHLVGRIFIKIVLLSFNIQSNFLLLFSLNSISTNYWPYPLGYCPSWLWRNHRDRSDSVRARIRPRASVRVGRYLCRRSRHLATLFDCRPAVRRNCYICQFIKDK